MEPRYCRVQTSIFGGDWEDYQGADDLWELEQIILELGSVCDVRVVDKDGRVVPFPLLPVVRRPALANVTNALRNPGATCWNLDHPYEGMEVLATRGLLPVAWLGDAARAWVWDSHGPRRRIEGRPWTISHLVAWASLGVDGILAAESLAREAVERLRPWGVRETPSRIVWDIRERQRVAVATRDGSVLYSNGTCRACSDEDRAILRHAREPLVSLAEMGLGFGGCKGEGAVVHVPGLREGG
jgi:hypothetical protein